MKKFAWLFVLLWPFAVAVFGQQINSSIHVNQFPGGDVGTMLANAQKTCVTAPTPCILVLDPSLHSTPAGTMPTLCGNCYLVDWRNGPPTGMLASGEACRSVTSFGAKCDGTTDDSAAIQAALNSALPCITLPPSTTTSAVSCKVSTGLNFDGARMMDFEFANSMLLYAGTGSAITEQVDSILRLRNGVLAFPGGTTATAGVTVVGDPCVDQSSADLFLDGFLILGGPAGYASVSVGTCDNVLIDDVVTDGDLNVQGSTLSVDNLQMAQGATVYLDSMQSAAITGLAEWNLTPTLNNPQPFGIDIENTLHNADVNQLSGADTTDPAPAAVISLSSVQFQQVSGSAIAVEIGPDANGNMAGGVEGSFAWQNQGGTAFDMEETPTSPVNLSILDEVNNVAEQLIYNPVFPQLPTPSGSGETCLERDSNGIVASTGAPCYTGPGVTRVNCLTTACAGGSTYASGTTYTNSLSSTVTEEVTLTATGGSCAGSRFVLSSTIGGTAGPSQGISNACDGVASIVFQVFPGQTFSVTAAQTDGGGAEPFSITRWQEVQ
jgi:hypothetical protein